MEQKHKADKISEELVKIGDHTKALLARDVANNDDVVAIWEAVIDIILGYSEALTEALRTKR